MARVGDAEQIYETAGQFLRDCVYGQGSLYGDEDSISVWSDANIDQALLTITGQNADEGERDFYTKLSNQVGKIETPTDRQPIARLFIEAVHLYQAYRLRTSAEGMADRLKSLAVEAGYSESERQRYIDSPFINDGVGAVGQNARRIYEGIVLLLHVIQRLRQAQKPEDPDTGARPHHSRSSAEFPTEARAFARALCGEARDLHANGLISSSRPFLTHTLPHLFYPDYFEAWSATSRKREIISAFSELLDSDEYHWAEQDLEENEDELDLQLWQIRCQLRNEALIEDPDTQFWYEPLASCWMQGSTDNDAGPDEASMVQALRMKNQIVLHGPPGTSKSYLARAIARRIIGDGIVARQGIREYLQRHVRRDTGPAEKAIEERIGFLQLHPGFAYEDFIGGWQITPNGTEFRPGYLPRFVEEHVTGHDAEDGGLPAVIILDELNRTDLSRVMGEMFNLLDNRDGHVLIPAPQGGESAYRLELPQNVYIIGTMNEIDHSVEMLDYAMRRRFLWFECSYEETTLEAMLRNPETYAILNKIRRTPLDGDRAAQEFEIYVERATSLNREIAESAAFGPEYVIGHTIFADVIKALQITQVGLTNHSIFLYSRPRGKGSTAQDRQPDEAIRLVWELSLEPLLKAYLAMRPDEGEQHLARLKSVFMNGQ